MWNLRPAVIIQEVINYIIAAITVTPKPAVQIATLPAETCDRPRLLETHVPDLSELSILGADVKMIRPWEDEPNRLCLPPPTRHANHAGDGDRLSIRHRKPHESDAA